MRNQVRTIERIVLDMRPRKDMVILHVQKLGKQKGWSLEVLERNGWQGAETLHVSPEMWHEANAIERAREKARKLYP